MMNEVEKLQRARMYMVKLAEGIDPLTDAQLPSDTALNSVNLSRCFFYVSEVLGRVIDNGGEVGSTGDKVRFHITDEQKSSILVTPESVGVNELARRINAAIDAKRIKGASGVKINNWLVSQGLLQIITQDDKPVKVVSPEGEGAGIRTESVTTLEGRTFLKNLYSDNMQKYIIDRIEEIMNGSP